MAKPLYKVLEVDSTLQAFCKHPDSAAMSPYSA
jgi:hypothetical protein